MSDYNSEEAYEPYARDVLQTFGEVEWCMRSSRTAPMRDAYHRLFRRALACATLAESGPRGFAAALHYPSVVNWWYGHDRQEETTPSSNADDSATVESAQSDV